MKPLSPDIPEVLQLEPSRFEDERGFFSETFCQNWFDEADLGLTFRQDNHAHSNKAGVIRGLHFQYGTAPQAKLIRCAAGAIFDVAVDIRQGSPTFGHYVAAELTAENWCQLFIPHGFAHGYCTLSPETEVLYKVDNFYDSDQEASIRWDDPALGIDWPVPDKAAILSDKDKIAPLLSGSGPFFTYKKGHGPFNVICLEASGDRLR